MEVLDFVSVIILAFAVILLLAGLFTAYFGNGKSRMTGILMLVCSIVVGILWIFLCGGFGTDAIIKDVDIWNVFLNALIYIAGALIGAIVAVGIFLVAVLKS